MVLLSWFLTFSATLATPANSKRKHPKATSKYYKKIRLLLSVMTVKLWSQTDLVIAKYVIPASVFMIIIAHGWLIALVLIITVIFSLFWSLCLDFWCTPSSMKSSVTIYLFRSLYSQQLAFKFSSRSYQDNMWSLWSSLRHFLPHPSRVVMASCRFLLIVQCRNLF